VQVLVQNGFHAFDDLLQVDHNDLAGIPEIGDQAGAIIEAVRSEAAKRNQGNQ
jgi:hypothetical protein